CAAHAHGIAVMLDVVYNHFGPEGNFLHLYAPQFFTDRHATPWGAAIDFEASGRRAVRDFFLHNALYWLEEYHLDGLRLDAVHAIIDTSEPHILTEIAHAVRSGPGRERPVYLVLENLANEARRLGSPGAANAFDAQWNDDSHHCLHVLVTGESDGYYEDYRDRPHRLLCRSLAEGFAYQGESSRHLGRPRGELSALLPPSAFVNFLQNHDQVGNRVRALPGADARSRRSGDLRVGPSAVDTSGGGHTRQDVRSLPPSPRHPPPRHRAAPAADLGRRLRRFRPERRLRGRLETARRRGAAPARQSEGRL